MTTRFQTVLFMKSVKKQHIHVEYHNKDEFENKF
jgi:hypothetical protein